MDKRPLFHKRDVWLLAGLLLLALAGFLFFKQSGQPAKTARIALDGQVVMTVSLEKDGEFALEQNPHIRFAVRDGAIAFTASDCPDRLCVRSGYLSRSGQTAACLPRRVSLSVEGSADPVDSVAG
jgi:hypothetical protein